MSAGAESAEMPGMRGRVVSLHVSNGGVPKRAIPEAALTEGGLAGDRQRHLEFHGGPDRALCLWAVERLEALRAEGHPIAPGMVGENLLVAGVDWSRVVPGARLAIGEALVEITSFAVPCRTIRDAFLGGRSGRISHKSHPGWSRVYARVLRGGTLRVGDEVVVEREAVRGHFSGVRVAEER